MTMLPRARPMGTGLVEATAPPEWFDFAAADRWSVVVLADGTPAVRIELPSPRGGGARFIDAAITRRADDVRLRERLRADLCERLGAPPHDEPPEQPRVSVVLCTHRRPHYIDDVLGGLSRLDPAPYEVVVVDNDPGDQDCRAQVAAAGFRYVREDRRGLDNARNAGIRAARGDVVIFTDDDCVPWPAWLRSIPRTFADPMVGAASGPAFPWLLDTPSRVRMERQAALSRGLERMVHTFQSISVVHAGGVGFGANMAFRRDVLLELGDEPFPPELDAGTPTESGGDYYVFARTIVNGHRVVYEPDMFTFHQHRPDPRAVHKAIRGYGVGCSAAMSKLVLECRELEGYRGWWWFITQYARTQRRRVVGRSDTVETRLACEFIIGAVLGPRRWRKSLAQQRAIMRELPVRGGSTAPEAVDPPAAPAASVTSPARGGSTAHGAVDPPAGPPEPVAPRLSVVIPTHRRPEALARCLDHLTRQTLAPGAFEVVVIDDADPPVLSATEVARPGLRIRLVASGGVGASDARNLGAEHASAPVVLFLDDDLVPAPQVLERHLARHDAATVPTAVIGPYPPAPPAPGLAARSTAVWWNDTFEHLRRSTQPTFMYALSGSMSVPRDTFLAVGGFSDDIPYRREDWELGLRWLNAGHALAYEPDAPSRHEYTLTTASRLRGAELEGFGDAVLVEAHPDTIGTLPLAMHVPPAEGGAVRRRLFAAWRHATVRDAVLRVLDILEAGNLRTAWFRLMRRAQAASYYEGLRRAGWTGPAPKDLTRRCELLDDAPLTFEGPTPPTVEVTVAGRLIGRVRPAFGMWGPHIADDVVRLLGGEDLDRIATAKGWAAPDVPPSPLAGDVEVVELPAGDHAKAWAHVARRAAATDRPLVAVPLARDTAPDRRWLHEALEAFDGTEVEAVFGGALAATRSAQPLYLHDAAAPPWLAVGDVPAYLIVRAERLRELGGVPVALARHGAPAPLLGIVEALLASGALVARRDVRGLARPSVSAVEQGEAWGAVRLAHAPSRRAAIVRGTGGVLATLLWRTYKGRGRVDASLLGAVGGLARALVRSSSPRR